MAWVSARVSVVSGQRPESNLTGFSTLALLVIGKGTSVVQGDCALPQKFRTLCEDLVIRIEDFATDEVLDDMDIDHPFDLLGLFQGVGLPFRAESAPTHMPNMIWLYRRPILDYWSDHEESLGAVVAHVLVHEIGHHFGLSDDDMEAIEADAD
jgi:predicted Zn-dependent protease with MMP-like domain